MFIYLFIFIFGCAGPSLLCRFVSEGGGRSLAVVHGLLIATAPLVEHRPGVFKPQELQHVGTAVAVPGLYHTGAIVVGISLVALLH